VVDLDRFSKLTGATITVMPRNVAAVGWGGKDIGWICGGDPSATNAPRLADTVRHLRRALRPTKGTPSFWLFCCISDGWRERVGFSRDYRWVDPTPSVAEDPEWQGDPGTIPRLSPTRSWVACFSAQLGDPSAVLLPEAHFLARNGHGYRRMLLATRAARRPWVMRRARASYAGFDPQGPVRPESGRQLRRNLKAMVEADDLPVDVYLGRSMPRRRQLKNRYVIDIDGSVRTWDAWAWKVSSNSLVLSPESTWETRFTRLFEAWTHFVPLKHDLSDLADRLAWCQSHDAECRRIAKQARRRARPLYRRRAAEEATRRLLTPLLLSTDCDREHVG
jgi:hypothetical protein